MSEGLLRVNIKQFEGEEDFSKYLVDGELDVDSIINDYSSSQQDNEFDDVVDDVDETPPAGNDDLPPEGDETPPATTDDTPPPAPEETPPAEEPKRTPDQAFADMRRKIESYEPLAKWVETLAQQQGFQDPQELINAFAQRQMEKEAQEQGVPLDVYQRLQQLEQENKAQQDNLKSQQFNSEVEQVKTKYNLDDAALTEVFRFMGQKGYDAGDIPFEDAYVLANRETLIQQAEERGRQSYLEEKRKQQQGATQTAGTAAEDVPKGGTELDYSSEGILAAFKNLDIAID